MPKGDHCEDGAGGDDEYGPSLGPIWVVSASSYLSASQTLSYLIATTALCVDIID